MMHRYSGLPILDSSPAVVTIGVFDGMHRGHQSLIRQLADHAHTQQLRAVVVTFDPHPDSIVRPIQFAGLLQTPADRISMMAACGIDAVHSVAFDHDIQQWSAADFMTAVARSTHVSELWVGWDFALGRQREGNHERLRDIGHILGYQLNVRPRHDTTDGAPSASVIRQALKDGAIVQANHLLGRRHAYHGPVVSGDRRGRTIGFPTANIQVDARVMLPRFGVYACVVTIAGTRYQAVTNIGVRPTFQGREPRIEAHLIDVNVDVYDQLATIEFVDFIRPEQKFNGIDALIQQIRNDTETAKQRLHVEER